MPPLWFANGWATRSRTLGRRVGPVRVRGERVELRDDRVAVAVGVVDEEACRSSRSRGWNASPSRPRSPPVETFERMSRNGVGEEAALRGRRGSARPARRRTSAAVARRLGDEDGSARPRAIRANDRWTLPGTNAVGAAADRRPRDPRGPRRRGQRLRSIGRGRASISCERRGTTRSRQLRRRMARGAAIGRGRRASMASPPGGSSRDAARRGRRHPRGGLRPF